MAIICRVALLIWMIACVMFKIHAATIQKRDVIDENNNDEINNDETAASYAAFEQDHIALNDSKVVIDLYSPSEGPPEINPDESSKSTTTNDETEASYGASEQDHIAVNDSKVVIDFYSPTEKQHETKPDESFKSGTTVDKNVTPFVQVVITQPDAVGLATTKDTQADDDSVSVKTVEDLIISITSSTSSAPPTIEAPSTTAHSLPLIPPASVNASINKLEKESKQKQGQIIISSEPDCPSLLDADNLSQTQLMKRLTHVCRYDRLERPVSYDLNGDRKPISVYTRAYIYFMQNLEAHDLEFKVHALLQLRWVDPRLVFRKVARNRKEPIMGQSALRDSLWTPHLFLANERASSVLGTPEKDVLTAISPDGTVVTSTRIQATLHCWMNLQKYPFDEQKCKTVFESWLYNTTELELHWEERSPITLAPELHLTKYVLMNLWTNETTINADLSDLRHGAFTGNYSSLSFTLHLAREMGFYIMDYFLPSIMIVSISWVSFWLQADATPPRIMLGTSTMLTFITLASAQGKTLPKVSYIKMSEVWFLGCCLFIFGSLVEFAFVNTIWRRKNNVELKKVNSKYILKSTLTPRPTRKDMNTNLQKSRSCSSLDGNKTNSPNSNSFNNYLTVHSFPNNKIPTITTTQSMDDLTQENGNNICVNMEPSSSTTTLQMGPQGATSDVDPNHKQGFTTMTPQEIAYWIDRRSRVLFPSAFLVFNIFYWTFVYYL